MPRALSIAKPNSCTSGHERTGWTAMTLLLAQQPTPHRSGDEFSNGLNSHLFHYPLAARLDGALCGSEVMRNLLVDLATDDKFKDLSLTGRQAGDMGAKYFAPQPKFFIRR